MSMRVFLASVFLGAIASTTQAVNPNDPICACSSCCYVANETSTHFTGKLITQFTYPTVSFDGTYTLVGHQYDNGTALTVDNVPYQYVVKYENAFKDAFDRNILLFTDLASGLNCTGSHMYYGSPVDGTYKKIDFVSHDTLDYCTLDVQHLLTRDEIAAPGEVYFAFNDLMSEGSDFQIMYQTSHEGLIVPAPDIIEYPYVIHDGTVEATDVDEAAAFYVNVSLNVLDISVVDNGDFDQELAGCLSPDEIFTGGDAYFLTKTGGRCQVEILSNGTGDARQDPGRNYQLRIDQEDYQRCAVEDVQLVGDQLVFDFRLVLPRSFEDTLTSTDSEGCYYFAENENVQNVTISMSQDVAELIDNNFISNFNTRVARVEPVRCDDPLQFPTPHSQIKFTVDATFPSTFGNDFASVTLPNLEGLVVEWDTASGERPANIPCTDFAGEAGAEDDYRVCSFHLRSQTCEPTYDTFDGFCAFERNNTRLLTGFVLVEEMPGGQTATYPSEDLNLGLDNQKFDASLCDADPEDSAVSVNDVFNVDLELQNYYPGFPVDWAETGNFTMNQDMIARLKVGQRADSPFQFDDDLELMIKTATVELSNPVTRDIITSYTWSPVDKADFMQFSWTPYHSDPRFCTWYNRDATDKCERFFVDGVRSNVFHDTTWISNTMPLECQETGTLAGEQDTNNFDYFLFRPRDWFRDNAAGLVDMKMRVTGIIHKCSDNNNPSRLLEAVNAGRIRGATEDGSRRDLQVAPERDILYISEELVISFVTKDNGDSHVEVVDIPRVSWFEENKTLVFVASILAGVVALGFVVAAISRRKRYMAVKNTATRIDF